MLCRVLSFGTVNPPIPVVGYLAPSLKSTTPTVRSRIFRSMRRDMFLGISSIRIFKLLFQQRDPSNTGILKVSSMYSLCLIFSYKA